jgi:signal recognition particle subunit SRP68
MPPTKQTQVDTPPEPAVPLGPFSLPVLKTIMEAQGLHGLRYGDYQRYRQYCARRTQRLRKGLSFVHWEQGKGKSKFVQREITEEAVVDVRFLELVLFKAERCWAYAMQLRDPPGGVPGREVHHMARLLAKAAKHSAQLESLARCASLLSLWMRKPPEPWRDVLLEHADVCMLALASMDYALTS